ncbi:hypothetical protein GW935_03490 [Candidatus Falkowbacteria bacterium]|nr:hypothetical protein [Candidatus Falkowbacteria bacterium]
MENQSNQINFVIAVKDELKDIEHFLQEPNPQWDIIKYKLSGLKSLIGE